MNSSRLSQITALLTIVILLSSAVYAVAGPGLMGGNRGGVVLRVLMQLDLTNDQKAAVLEIKNKYQDQGQAIRSQVQNRTEAFKSEIEAADFDEQAVRQAFQAMAVELTPILEEGAVLRAKIAAEMRDVLTDQQEIELAQMRADFKAKQPERWDQRQQMLDTWLRTPAQ